jgi:hypothetical protein
MSLYRPQLSIGSSSYKVTSPTTSASYKLFVGEQAELLDDDR